MKGRWTVKLEQMKCEACRAGAPTVSEEDIRAFQPQVPDWRVVERQGIKRLERSFRCKDFAQALAFTNEIGKISEIEDHHPAILTEWGRTTVTWWTHKIKGLHRNDFIMAARTDALFEKGVDSRTNG